MGTWQEPKTNWQAADVVSKDDFNRIEGNVQELQNTKETPAGAQSKVDTHANSKQSHGISGGYYIAKTSRSDQLPAWNDIQGKPSLVTPSDLSNALAAKVDKPSSATSGNIAVFDGGAGKIKDGGKQITDFALNNSIAGNAPVYADSSDVYSDAFGYPNYIELKACKVYMIGTVRIKFDLCAPGGKQLWARIYKNGVAVGTERTTTSTSFTTFTEDIGNMSSGDRLSIYGKHGGSTQSAPALRNFIVSIGGNAPIAEKVL